jgi:hypothetical protein
MKGDAFLLLLSVLAVFLFGFALDLYAFSGGITRSVWSGFASSDISNVSINIEEIVLINFTTDTIDWGIGRVYPGLLNATLDTSESNPLYKSKGGNWTGAYGNYSSGFILENIGNVNAVLYLKSSKNASSFLGGTNPAYQFNITNNESQSCINTTGFFLGQYFDVNTTLDGTKVCDLFSYHGENDTVRIDIFLRIPSDSRLGFLQDTIVATAHRVV